MYLTPQRPAPSGPRTLPLPPLLRSHVVYALTAFDPPGESRTLAANAAANGELWAGIRKLDPQPAAAWPTWGYNLDEGWRDSLAYPRDGGRADDARKAVVKLARKFGQGAIFEYAPSESLTDGLVRTTVPALSSEAVREVVNVWRVPEVPVEAAPALLERPWAGPAEAAGGWVRSVE